MDIVPIHVSTDSGTNGARGDLAAADLVAADDTQLIPKGLRFDRREPSV
jgi:hypothetical protein